MPQQILVPWNATERGEGRTPWLLWSGAYNTVLQAADGVNYVYQQINYGINDTNSLDGADWRTSAGAAFPWTGKTPSQLRLEWDIYNFGLAGNAVGLAIYLADVPQTWYVEMFNATASIAPNAWTWVDFGITANPSVLNALAAGNLHTTLIFYNHTGGSQKIGVDACRITVDYSGGVGGIWWAEI